MEKLRLANPARPWLPSRYLSSSSCWRIPLCQLLRRSLYHLRTPQHHCGWIQDHVNWRFYIKIDWKNLDKKNEKQRILLLLECDCGQARFISRRGHIEISNGELNNSAGNYFAHCGTSYHHSDRGWGEGPFIYYTIQFMGLRPLNFIV